MSRAALEKAKFYKASVDAEVGSIGTTNLVYTDDASSRISGTTADDVIFDLAGNDEVFAGRGNDWMVGGAGRDLYHGGIGIDHVAYTSSPTGVVVILEEGRTLDTNPLTSHARGDTYDSIEGFVGSAFDDTIYAFDASVSDTGSFRLFGYDGNDDIIGSSGSDEIRGGDGNDTLQGGGQRDFIFGGEGNDTITGGSGDDVLFGGLGADVFIYRFSTDLEGTPIQSGPFGNDVISDWEAGDRISFQGLPDEYTADMINLTQVGDDTLIFVEGFALRGTITVLNANAQTDFVF